MKVKNSDTWNTSFYPCYTPEEMLDLGVFMDCHYNVAIKGLPASWYKHPNVYPRDKEPDVEKNHFGVKSRQSLKEWEKNDWTTKDSPLGWWEWYAKYFYGRRLEKEDKWQIGRWRSFVARHMGQINANCDLKNKDCRPVQRQGLLQWAWDSSKKFTDEQQISNLKKFGIEFKPSQESQILLPDYLKW